ncbi:hypothetical protein [Levilactobacillus brevis]|uniref:hypothetical protein n=1 Tax=Levilactobacillus brevis TaxID=1580 RepID=UPI000B139220|nr:hypothetical protein [Levilactobacillus brevis]
MGIVHIAAEIVVFFAAISLIYYFFQITQALGERKQNIKYLIIAAVVLLIAYPVSNLSGKKRLVQLTKSPIKSARHRKSTSNERNLPKKRPSLRHLSLPLIKVALNNPQKLSRISNNLSIRLAIRL